MKFFITIIISLVMVLNCKAQSGIVTGKVFNILDNLPIQDAGIWNNDEPGYKVYSQQDGHFELTNTSNERFLLICKKKGFQEFGTRVTPPHYGLNIFLRPDSVKVLEVIIVVRKNDNSLLDSVKYQFENIEGFDCINTDKKKTFKIPINEIEKRKDTLKLNIERRGYKTLSRTIFFNEDEISNKFKGVELFMQQDTTPGLRKKNMGIKINSSLLISGTLYSGASWLIYNKKAHDLYSNISPSLSLQKINDWGNYKKFKTRSNLFGLTAINSTLSSLPFTLAWTSNSSTNIDERLLSSVKLILL